MRVVCVDDDWTVIRTLQLLLEAQGHEVIVCGEPLDAIAKVEQSQKTSEPVQAIITDFMMPGFTGVEVLEVMLQLCPHVRRILLTAAPNEPEVREAVKTGLAQFLIEKPWTRAELKRALAP